MGYTPPFTVSPRSITLVAQIAERVAKLSVSGIFRSDPKLRRINRIRSIHSSLAIEGNTLSVDEVTDIIDGKRVLGDRREIQEVKNAFSAYDLLDGLNPYDSDDLLLAHGTMMKDVIDDAGSFRRTGVGVYSGTRLIHMAPPYDRVPQLIGQLMDWAGTSEDHPLIKGCVFHYEFEFIHPFSDGNGRTGRLWHTLILSKWNEAMASVPIESVVRKHQMEYYDAIAKSTAAGDSGPFIEFMLGSILEAVEGSSVQKMIDELSGINRTERKLLHLIADGEYTDASSVALLLGVSISTVDKTISLLKSKGLIVRNGSNKLGTWKILIDKITE